MANVDQQLLGKLKEIDVSFDKAIDELYREKDSRVFFALSHGYITKKIAKHIGLFNAPNPLIELNNSFALEFINAINGHPHAGWTAAFRRCDVLDEYAARAKDPLSSLSMLPLLPYTATAFEQCAGCMAYVHISQDLKKALQKVRNVDAQDYGNVLVFVLEGHLFAEVKCRGAGMGAAVFMIGHLIMEWLNSNAKRWRNEAFQEVYKKQVPDPSVKFLKAYRAAEGR